MGNFFIEVRLEGKIEQLKIVPLSVDDDNNMFQILCKGKLIAILILDYKMGGWIAVDGNLNSETIDEIGSKIESHYE